jgi:enoyl-CoA hydratase
MSIDLDKYKGFGAESVEFDEPRPGVLRMRLIAPERWNPIPLAVHDGLPELFAVIADDRVVHAFMLAGTGKIFSSGGDVDEGMKLRDIGELVELQRIAVRIITRLLEIPQPTFCVVNGPAIGFAASLALNFDFIIASENARFSDSHAAFGAVPGDGLMVVLLQAVGPALAKEVLFGGRELTAQEAMQHGLVNRVVDLEKVEDEAFALLERVQGLGPLAVRMAKVAVNTRLRAEAEEVLNAAASAEMLTLASEDFRNAVEGFMKDRCFAQDWKGA